jgi:hypothetical protein
MNNTISIQSYGGVEYKVHQTGTWYHKDTPDAVIHVLEVARQLGYTVRVFYGDPATGRDWMEQYDVTGRIGRSTGPVRVPLLLHNSRSRGGGAILTNCILRVLWKDSRGYRHEWRVENYQKPDLYMRLRHESDELHDGRPFVVMKRNSTSDFPYYERLQDEIDGGKPTKAGSNPVPFLLKKDETVAQFTKATKATRWMKFITGERMTR